MKILQTVYLGNTLQDWLIAACIFMVALAVLVVLKRIILSRLSRLATATENKLDDMLVDLFKQTKILILIVFSAYVASYAVTLKPNIEALWQKAVLLILIFQGGLWASVAVSFGLSHIMQKRMDQDTSSATTIAFLGFMARLVLWVIVLLLVLDNLGFNITGLVAGLGIGGIAVALAVQNILGDLLASLSIVLDKPFVIGDFVVIDSFMGTIEHIGLKSTRIRSLSGEQLVISNNDLLKSRISNYKKMRERRVAFNFGVIYQTPRVKLKLINKIVSDIIREQANARFDRVHFKEYGDSSLNYEVVYYVETPDYNVYMDIQQAINLEMFRRFQEESIEFAYPTQTIFIQQTAN